MKKARGCVLMFGYSSAHNRVRERKRRTRGQEERLQNITETYRRVILSSGGRRGGLLANLRLKLARQRGDARLVRQAIAACARAGRVRSGRAGNGRGGTCWLLLSLYLCIGGSTHTLPGTCSRGRQRSLSSAACPATTWGLHCCGVECWSVHCRAVV